MPVEVQMMVIIMSAVAFSSTVWAGVHFKLKKKELDMRGYDPEVGLELDALREDLNDARLQLSEVQERLDFAERMLTSGPATQGDQSE